MAHVNGAASQNSPASAASAPVVGSDMGVMTMSPARLHEIRDLLSEPFDPGEIKWRVVVHRSSIQIPDRKRPVRHVVLLSKGLFETKFGSNAEARRTVLYDDSAGFVLHRLAVRFGLPVLPEWAEWFRAELERRNLIEELVGINCSPIAVKGTKLRMLRILSQGLRRHAIAIPTGNPPAPGPSQAA